MEEDPESLLLRLAREGDAAACGALLGRGVRPDARDRAGQTPLHIAAFFGHAEVCRLLLRHGAIPEAPDREGRPPLIYAASRGHLAICGILLEAGAPSGSGRPS